VTVPVEPFRCRLDVESVEARIIKDSSMGLQLHTQLRSGVLPLRGRAVVLLVGVQDVRLKPEADIARGLASRHDSSLFRFIFADELVTVFAVTRAVVASRA
jgi:hypothetical protein